MLTVHRREQKYLLSKANSVALQAELARLLTPDAFAREGYYRVRSLYFDSANDMDYTEKVSGQQRRKKLRLRIYGTFDKTIKLECKAKDGDYQKKWSLSVTREEANALQNASYACLLERSEAVAKRLYLMLTQGAYRPVCIVEYDRRAFVYPDFNTRITFDERICTTERDLRLFADSLSLMPVYGNGLILEVKYNDVLAEPIRRILAKYTLSQTAFSKYGMARGEC